MYRLYKSRSGINAWDKQEGTQQLSMWVDARETYYSNLTVGQLSDYTALKNLHSFDTNLKRIVDEEINKILK